MIISSTNLCTRCGQPRIDSRTWLETITTAAGVQKITHIQTVCPDPDCQKIVEARLEELREKADKIKQTFEKRALEKKLQRSQIHFTKASKSLKMSHPIL